MRETRLSGSEGGGARDSPYPYNSFRRYASNDLNLIVSEFSRQLHFRLAKLCLLTTSTHSHMPQAFDLSPAIAGHGLHFRPRSFTAIFSGQNSSYGSAPSCNRL